ncbi:MAG: thiamine phosphate synthase [Bacteroidota bacterium]
MKLLLVSNFYDVPYEHYLLHLIFSEGLEYFHLRKKEFSEDAMRRYLDRIHPVFYPNIILHSHFHLVAEYGLGGAHFTRKSIYEDFAVGENVDFHRKGFSLHSTAEVAQLESSYHYIFLSPVFDSISNKGYNSKFKLSNLRQFLQTATSRPEIIALGGINHTRVEQAASLGFDGIALLGHIWADFETNPDLVSAVKRFERVRNAISSEQLTVDN